MKAYLVSLGCPKNLTDTEVLMGKLASEGNEITTDPAEAETIIINTCAFLKSARDEAKAVIKEMAQWKKKGKCRKLYIAGCLPKWLNRRQSSPPLSPSPSKMERGRINLKLTGGEAIDGFIDSLGLFEFNQPRLKATPPWTAYVKIAEGCDHRCTFCLIPTIRGNYRIRQVQDILKEIEGLARRGVKEIVLIAEDTTAHPDLAEILKGATKIKGLRWIRIMYAHPAHLTEDVIEAIAREKKIVKYLDLPIQHASDKLLKLMGRRYTRRELENLISKIRRRIPEIALRTTVIVGFPGEGKAEFAELLEFIQQAKFAKLGCFAYQREEGTPAGKMRGQVSETIKVERAKKVMRAQARVSRELNKKMIGRMIEILIEGRAAGSLAGRGPFDAPEIDGSVFIKSKKILTPGRFVRVRVSGASTHNLFGSVS